MKLLPLPNGFNSLTSTNQAAEGIDSNSDGSPSRGAVGSAHSPTSLRPGILTICRDECSQVVVPDPSFDKVDQGRKDDNGHDEEEG